MTQPSSGRPGLQRPDSWPLTGDHMTPFMFGNDNFSDEDDAEAEDDMSLLQQNPLMYFLTPPTPKEEELEFEFDFDAGIEDSTKPRDIVRSISPSTLDGLRRYKPRRVAADCVILDDEDDEDDGEDYIRFRPGKAIQYGNDELDPERPRLFGSPSPGSSPCLSPSLSPTSSFHVGSPRGRPQHRFAPPRRPFSGRARSISLQRRHSWREPSPDVWSIEEEPEKETMSEMGLSVDDMLDGGEKRTQPIDIPAAKPKKKVRFVLPATH